MRMRLTAVESRYVSIMSERFGFLTTRPLSQSVRQHYPVEVQSTIPIEHVVDGSRWQADCWLFQLPIELLLMIINEIPAKSLNHFGAASHTCRQFARWRQFRRVQISHIYDTEEGHGLLSRLCAQPDSREHYTELNLCQPLFALGRCIQELVMCTEAISFARLLDKSFPQEHFHRAFVERSKDMRQGRDNLATGYYSKHLERLAFAIKYALPYLRKIRFEDKAPLPRGMWHALLQSTVRELDLSSCVIGAPVEPPLPPHVVSWPLTSLRIGAMFYWDNLHHGAVDTNKFCGQLLRICASTLRSLSFTCCDRVWGRPNHDLLTLEDINSLQFPLLTEADLNVCCDNLALFRAIFWPSPSLEAISLKLNSNLPSLDQLWPGQSMEYPSLKHLTVAAVNSRIACPLHTALPLIRSNHGIKSLRLDQTRASDGLLRCTILPLLSSCFSCLSSLSLTINHDFIDEGMLQMIGTICSLRQLRIKAPFEGPREECYWLINHKSVRQCLANLNRLQYLSFSGDTYVSAHGFVPWRYYTLQKFEHQSAPGYNDVDDDTPPPFDYDSATEELMEIDQEQPRTCIVDIDAEWRVEHRRRMLRHARNYFVKFPQLKWVYFGRMIMGPSHTSRSHKPRNLSKSKVDVTELYMDYVFGWPTFIQPLMEEFAGYGTDVSWFVLDNL